MRTKGNDNVQTETSRMYNPEYMTDEAKSVLAAYNKPVPWADIAYLVVDEAGKRIYRVRNTKHHGKIGTPVYIVVNENGEMHEVEPWSDEDAALTHYLRETDAKVW